MATNQRGNIDRRDCGPAVTICRFEQKGLEDITTRELFDYADALRQVGRREHALLKYRELGEFLVFNKKAWLVDLYKGQTLYDMGKFAEAETSFRDACDGNPATVPRIYLAGALAAQERFEDALEILRSALDSEGDQDEVWLNIALNQRTLGNLEDAQNSLLEALSLSPSYEAAVNALADVRAALSLKHP